MTYKVGQTTPATSWEILTPGDLPKQFEDNRYPKAIFLNTAGTVQLVGKNGISVTFAPAEGVPIPVRPTSIQSANVDVIVLYD